MKYVDLDIAKIPQPNGSFSLQVQNLQEADIDYAMAELRAAFWLSRNLTARQRQWSAILENKAKLKHLQKNLIKRNKELETAERIFTEKSRLEENPLRPDRVHITYKEDYSQLCPICKNEISTHRKPAAKKHLARITYFLNSNKLKISK